MNPAFAEALDSNVHTARIALLVCAAFVVFGCANYAAWDFPRARGREGGVVVRFKARLVGLEAGSPAAPESRTLHIGEKAKLTAVFVITDSRPRIPPLIPKRKVRIGLDRPPVFFGTNEFLIGGMFEKTLAVWRGPDGRLHAAEPE